MILLEVMDKEPTLALIWGCAIFLAASGFIGCRYNHRFGFLVFPVVLVLSMALLLELNDQAVGQAIIREAGISYVIESYIAVAMAFGFPLWGAIHSYRHRRTSRLPNERQEPSRN